MEEMNSVWLLKGQQCTSSFDIKISLISSNGSIEQSQNIMSCVTKFLRGGGEKSRLITLLNFKS